MRKLSTRIDYYGRVSLYTRAENRALSRPFITNHHMLIGAMNECARASASHMCVREDEWMCSRRAYFGERVTTVASGNSDGMRIEMCIACRNKIRRQSVRSFHTQFWIAAHFFLCTNHPNINDEQKRFSRFHVTLRFMFCITSYKLTLTCISDNNRLRVFNYL